MRGPDAWSVDDVRSVMQSAWDVLSADRLAVDDLPSDVRAMWPATVRNRYEESVFNRYSIYRPNSLQIDQATLAVGFILYVDCVRDRRALAARLTRARWKMISAFDGRSRVYLSQKVLPRACRAIADRLNAELKVMPAQFTELTKFCR